MTMHEDILSLQKQVAEHNQRVQTVSEAAHADQIDVDLSADESRTHEQGASLEQLVSIRTQQLEEAVNDLRESQAALLNAQKMEAVGQLSAGMAHEINTPMQYIGGNLEFMKESFSELCNAYNSLRNFVDELDIDKSNLPEKTNKIAFVLERLPRAIDQSLDGVENISRIVRAMKSFSFSSDETEQFSINEGIESTLTVAKAEWKYVADAELHLDGDLPKLLCSPGELNQVFLNLIVNAAHAIEEKRKQKGMQNQKGLITISTNYDDTDIFIQISDTGVGISDADIDRVFDPFFTTKEVGKGTGQGLTVCHSILVDKYGGKIKINSKWGKGTTFTIRLPRDWQPQNNTNDKS